MHLCCGHGLQSGGGLIFCSSQDAYLDLLAKGLDGRLVLLDRPLESEQRWSIETKTCALARELDLHVAMEIASALNDYVSQGWDYWDKVAFAQSLLFLKSSLRPEVLETLPRRIAICSLANFQDYGNSSALTANLVSRALKSSGREVSRLVAGTFGSLSMPAGWRHTQLALPQDFDRKSAKLIHFPTAFHSKKELEHIYGGPEFLDLQSPFFDVGACRQRITLRRTDIRFRAENTFLIEKCALLYEKFVEQLDLQNLPVINLQIQHWKDRLAFQLHAYRTFRKLRKTDHISLAAMSDHDGGLLGPLCSAFHQQKEVVQVFPHSTICVGPLPDIPCHVESWLDSMEPLPPFGSRDFSASKFSAKNPRRRCGDGLVTIVLNEMDSFGGVPVNGFQSAINFIERFIKGLRSRGLRVALRPRSSSPLHLANRFDAEVYGGELGYLVERSWLCVGIGVVTTALLQFWREGISCIQVQEAKLGVSCKYILPSRGVNCFSGRPYAESLPGVLGYIDELVTNPNKHRLLTSRSPRNSGDDGT
jgi:hypothetical protein